MTHDQMLTQLRSMANRGSDLPHTTLLRHACRKALGQASRRKLVTHETNFRIAVVAGTIGYALPTTNIAGAAISLQSFYTNCFRAKGVGEIPFRPADELDKTSPEWLDSAEQASGTVEAVSFTDNQIKVYKPASAAFATANPYIYGRGIRQIRKPYADGTTVVTGEVTWASEIDFPFDDYHDGFVHGAYYWTLLDARQPKEAHAVYERLWKPFLMELDGLSVAEGLGVDQIEPAGQFVDVGSSAASDDYGTRWQDS